MQISIIAAIGKNRELGKDNKLLWHIHEDFKRFKDLTSGHVVIMGRKTYESLPEKFRPLPNRVNVIVTRDINFRAENIIVCHSVEAAFAKAPASQGEIFIIGGASIYKQAIKYADKLYLTLVDKEYPDADAFFPEYDDFSKELVVGAGEEEGLKYKFVELLSSKG